MKGKSVLSLQYLMFIGNCASPAIALIYSTHNCHLSLCFFYLCVRVFYFVQLTVLPKFEVTVEPPAFVSLHTKEITATICAR